jgi:hypothetical protein
MDRHSTLSDTLQQSEDDYELCNYVSVFTE